MIKKISFIPLFMIIATFLILNTSCSSQDETLLMQQLDSMNEKIDKLSSENIELRDKIEEKEDTDIEFTELIEEKKWQHIYLTEEGSGDFGSIGQALLKIEPGGIIFLDPGTYYPEQNLLIDKAVSIMGAGMENTSIIYNSQPNIIEYIGEGTLNISGISFEREGLDWGDVIWIKSGRIDISDCRLWGATHFDKEEEGKVGGGMGILIWGDGTEGIISDCIIENNSVDGIHIRDDSMIDLVGNEIRYNRQYGISYWDDSQGTVRYNDCHENQDCGISLRDFSDVILTDNKCSLNEYSGIEFYGELTGIASGNDCSENLYHGFSIGGLAEPKLLGNICKDNTEVGIVFFEDSGGFAISNECTGNECGIYVDAAADPVLAENILDANDIDLQDNR